MNFEDLSQFFKSHDNYIILTHKNPDGDTLGSGFALCYALRNMGKNANVLNSDSFPARYDFLYSNYQPQTFDAKTIVAVDIADIQLLGSNLSEYSTEEAIDVCIDHHISNKHYAKETYVDGNSSAASLIIYELFKYMNVEITNEIAKCLYTGIATDTGCFKFENTIPKAHIAAADLMTYDINFALINRKMFDIKSRGRLKVEQTVMSNMEYFFDDKCAIILLTKALMKESNVEEAEFDGLASMPLQVDGVKIGITIKERHENVFKLSVRTTQELDASEFCQNFGGGGHIRAAGCEIQGNLSYVKETVLEKVKEILNKL